MKKSIVFTLLTLVTLCLTGCEAVEFVFKAGMISAIIIIAVIAGIIFWLVSKFRGKK